MVLDLEILLIAGGRSTALEIDETACRMVPGLRVERLWGDGETKPDGALAESDLEDWLSEQSGKIGYILSMVDGRLRRGWMQRLEGAGLRPFSVIAPGAWVSGSAKLGEGVYLAEGAVVSANAVIGDHSMVNYNVVVGHDTVVGSHCALNPGASIGGNVRIGDNILIGANSFVFQGKTVGADSKVDAMTYVDRDIPAGSVVSSRGGRLRVLPQIGCQAREDSPDCRNA